MNLIKYILPMVILIAITTQSLFSNDLHTIKIIAPTDVVIDYEKFIGPKKILDIKTYSGQFSRRDVVELVLIQKALYLGGYKGEIEILKGSSSDRIRRDIQFGNAHVTGTTDWSRAKSDLTNYYLSTPMIRNKEFVVGLYHSIKLKPPYVNSIEELRHYKMISNKMWENDWVTLTELKLKNIQSATNWIKILKMLDRGRADYTLAPFSSHGDMAIIQEGIRLDPVKGIKIGINGTRHFLISNNTPNSGQILKIINKGIGKLRQKGEIKKAYTESGFFNKKTKNWKLLNR